VGARSFVLPVVGPLVRHPEQRQLLAAGRHTRAAERGAVAPSVAVGVLGSRVELERRLAALRVLGHRRSPRFAPLALVGEAESHVAASMYALTKPSACGATRALP
jgi:hypothetical protein